MRSRWRAAVPARALCAGMTAAALLAGCTLTRPDPVVPAIYDLGPQPEHARSQPAIEGTVLIPRVAASAGLDEPAIVYRLLYDQRTRPQAYTLSRWSAEPASLMTDRLRNRFASVSGGVVAPGYGASTDYILRVVLEDFSQRFDAPDRSRVTLQARATLVRTADRALLAQRAFEIERPSAPDAAGAVKAFGEATDAFLDQLETWTVQHARPPTRPKP